MASCSCVSPKQFESIAPDRLSDSDSDFEKENDVKAVNTKRLPLSVATRNILKQTILSRLRSRIVP